jgi:hypothetical protein
VSDRDDFCAPQVFFFEPHDNRYLVPRMSVEGRDRRR